MLKVRSRLLGAVGAVAVAGAIAMSGVAVAAAAPHAARVSGVEQFQLMSTSATSSTSSIIARGVFTAGGVDHGGNKVDTAVFPGGSFKIAHLQGHGSQSFNPKTCLMTINQHGTYKLSGGTSAQVRRDQRQRQVPGEHPRRRRPLGRQVRQEQAAGRLPADHQGSRAGETVVPVCRRQGPAMPGR